MEDWPLNARFAELRTPTELLRRNQLGCTELLRYDTSVGRVALGLAAPYAGVSAEAQHLVARSLPQRKAGLYTDLYIPNPVRGSIWLELMASMGMLHRS
jgi:hypothetical protein